MAITYLSGQRVQGSSTGGGTITPTTDGSDTILKFTESGTFTPSSSFDVEYLVVAGGGAGGLGGDRGGGGGGAGGFRTATGFGVTAQTYTITVGAGGARLTSNTGTAGNNGADSVFSSITSTGGGGGGTETDPTISPGLTGGSGGGGAGSSGTASGSGTGSEGNAGGTGQNTADYYPGGGGGGHGAVGANATGGNQAGAGGVGTSNSITGSAVFYAGGGGGSQGYVNTGQGAGGNGGGGDGGYTSPSAEAGEANTGAGGGGTGAGSGGGGSGAGGSGIVIIRFATSGNSYIATMGTQDDKTTVTDVPAGSQFEETNTRKFYQRSGLPVSLDDMKCYYRFEQTSGNLENTASDIGSSDAIANSDLVVSNATQGTTGKIDYGVTFASGSEALKASSMSLADLGFLSNADALWTICGWVKATTRAGSEAIICNSDFGSDENGVLIRTADASGHINLICGTNGDDMFQATSGTVAIPDTNWNFLMVQYNNSTGNVKMSVNDGTVETVSKSSGGALTNSDTPSTYLYMGNVPELSNDWIGSLDEFVIFNRILTTAELTKIYNAGSGKLLGSGSWVERGTAI